MLIRSGRFGPGFDEGEPLVAKVGDDLQAAAEGFDVGGQGTQFGGAGLGVLDRGHAALSDAHPGSDLGLGDAETAVELAWPGNPDMPHMPESDVTFDTPWAGPGTARVNVMVGPVIPTI